MAASDQPSREEDRFFEVLAGREQGHAGAEAMREALEAEAKTLVEADTAPAPRLSESERAQREVIRSSLIQAGVLPTRSERPSRQASRGLNDVLTRWLTELHDLVFGTGWSRPVAWVAGLMMVSAVVFQLLPHGQDGDEVETVRGGAAQQLVVDDPKAVTQHLQARLQELGAEVAVVQLNEHDWAFEVSVPDEVPSAAILNELREAGVDIGTSGPFEFDVAKRRP